MNFASGKRKKRIDLRNFRKSVPFSNLLQPQTVVTALALELILKTPIPLIQDMPTPNSESVIATNLPLSASAAKLVPWRGGAVHFSYATALIHLYWKLSILEVHTHISSLQKFVFIYLNHLPPTFQNNMSLNFIYNCIDAIIIHLR